MEPSKYVAVPMSEIKNLEQARLRLFEILKDDPEKINDVLYGVTDVMYRIAHKRYQKVNKYLVDQIEQLEAENINLRAAVKSSLRPGIHM